MFVKVTALKPLSYQGPREKGDEFYMRRQEAKIAKAMKKVDIIEGSETVSPNIGGQINKIPATVQKTIVENAPPVEPVVESQTPAIVTEEQPALENSETPAQVVDPALDEVPVADPEQKEQTVVVEKEEVKPNKFISNQKQPETKPKRRSKYDL